MVEAKDKSIVDKMSLQIKDYIENKLKKIIMKKVKLQSGKIMEVKNL